MNSWTTKTCHTQIKIWWTSNIHDRRIKLIFATVTWLHVLMKLEITVLELDNKLLYVQLIDLVSNRNRIIRLMISRFKSVFQIKNNSQIIYKEFLSLSIFKGKNKYRHTQSKTIYQSFICRDNHRYIHHYVPLFLYID